MGRPSPCWSIEVLPIHTKYHSPENCRRPPQQLSVPLSDPVPDPPNILPALKACTVEEGLLDGILVVSRPPDGEQLYPTTRINLLDETTQVAQYNTLHTFLV